jgi:hypothetical protein
MHFLILLLSLTPSIEYSNLTAIAIKHDFQGIASNFVRRRQKERVKRKNLQPKKQRGGSIKRRRSNGQ